ncbi:unnamed protein product, partial [Rotaria sp. Silwood2]
MKLADPVICPPMTTNTPATFSPRPNDGLCTKATWYPEAKTVAGGNGYGSALNQLSHPHSIFLDPNDSDALYIVDSGNNRILKWDQVSSTGSVILGRMGRGNNSSQLNYPAFMTMDKLGTISLLRYQNVILAQQVHVDHNGTVFIADTGNHRVMKYSVNATIGEIVAGGNGQDIKLNTIGLPHSVFVDQLGSVYVVDKYNDRIVRWLKDAQSGTVIAGGPGP